MKELLKDFFYGQCANAYKYFGAHLYLNGYIFRVYAPLAKEVELVLITGMVLIIKWKKLIVVEFMSYMLKD